MSFIRTSLFSRCISSLTLIASTGYAQDDVRKRGDRACGGDLRKMCKQLLRADMAVLGCLQQNKVKLGGSGPSDRDRAASLGYWWSMIFSENRCPYFSDHALGASRG